jgi:hypothetical protein
MVDGLDHVRLAMPRGGEERAWAYFGGLLGLVELEKPAALDGLARGGRVCGAVGRGVVATAEVLWRGPFREQDRVHRAVVCRGRI